MALCPSLCEIESDDIKQIEFILSPEGEEVTKALFYSDCIRRLVLQAEADLMNEGARLVQQRRMKMDRPAKQTFRIGNQVYPINYAFVNTCFFRDVLDFEVEHIDGSDHWPLR
ncbi:hypothetical protein NDU88_002134 [Pleurodeles waltl]|uniref:Uncharacterized protein n=1 Tax=Pleurodeles waltl TaxID=8319 RepID=A0AAV7UUP4_PLEWA|nr:hypothetical protein NDU88_002133 [Pleurodeles waltl]KAJ1192828.1 hypothetical protein NDU88_002134 [Pleurodeles waltl]